MQRVVQTNYYLLDKMNRNDLPVQLKVSESEIFIYIGMKI